jgi:hypothetical protein
MKTLIPIIPIVLVMLAIWFLLRLRERRLRQAGRQPPAWAAFFDPRGWDYFCELVLGYFKRRGIEVEFDEQEGVLHAKPGWKLGLLNLAQLCARVERSKWPELVKKHFDVALGSVAEVNRIFPSPEGYAQVEQSLRVRIWPEATVGAVGKDKLVYRADLEGLYTVLVSDTPTSVISVPTEKTRSWGKSEAELFETAIANTRANFKPEPHQQELAEGVKIWLFSGEDFYISSQVLMLEQHPQCLGKFGALVAIPQRQALLCYPIEGRETVKALNQMIPLARQLEAQGPGSISANIYWYRDGSFVNLPYQLSNKTLQFFPPESFVQMLNDLPD